MATVKVSALSALPDASVTASDVVPVVDDIGGTPTTYRLSLGQLRTAVLTAPNAGGWATSDYLAAGAGTVPTTGVLRVGQGTLTTASAPLINSTATWNDAAVTFTHQLINVTDTASNAASMLADWQVGGSSKWKVTKAGAVTQAGALTVSSGGLTVSSGTTAVQALTATGAISNTMGGTASITTESTVNGAAVELAVVGKNSTGTARQARMGLNRFADDVWSISDGTTERLRVHLTTGMVTAPSGITVSAGGLTVSAGTTAVQALTATTGAFSTAVVLANNVPYQIKDSGGTGQTVLTMSAANVIKVGDFSTSFATQIGGTSITLTAATTISTGGLTVSAGTTAVQALTATTVTASGLATVQNGLIVTTGGATIAGGLTVNGSGLTVATGGASIGGNSTITGTLSGITTLTATSFVGALTGNASTATALQTARTINGTAFDGTANITVTAAAGTLTGATLNASVTASSLTSVGVLASPHMTSPVIDSGGLTVTAGNVNASSSRVMSGNLEVWNTWDGANTAGVLKLTSDTAATATAGAAALPAAPVGFLKWRIGSTAVLLPYYNI